MASGKINFTGRWLCWIWSPIQWHLLVLHKLQECRPLAQEAVITGLQDCLHVSNFCLGWITWLQIPNHITSNCVMNHENQTWMLSNIRTYVVQLNFNHVWITVNHASYRIMLHQLFLHHHFVWKSKYHESAHNVQNLIIKSSTYGCGMIRFDDFHDWPWCRPGSEDQEDGTFDQPRNKSESWSGGGDVWIIHVCTGLPAHLSKVEKMHHVTVPALGRPNHLAVRGKALGATVSTPWLIAFVENQTIEWVHAWPARDHKKWLRSSWLGRQWCCRLQARLGNGFMSCRQTEKT